VVIEKTGCQGLRTVLKMRLRIGHLDVLVLANG